MLTADQIQIISSSGRHRAFANRKSLASVNLSEAVFELYPNSVTLDAITDSLFDYHLSPVSLSVVQRIIERFSTSYRVANSNDSSLGSQLSSSVLETPVRVCPLAPPCPAVIPREITMGSSGVVETTVPGVHTSEISVFCRPLNIGDDLVADVPRHGQSTFVFNSVFPPTTPGLHRHVFSPDVGAESIHASSADFPNDALGVLPFAKNSRRHVLANGREDAQKVVVPSQLVFEPASLLNHIDAPSWKGALWFIIASRDISSFYVIFSSLVFCLAANVQMPWCRSFGNIYEPRPSHLNPMFPRYVGVLV